VPHSRDPPTIPLSVLRSAAEPGTVILVVGRPVRRAGIPRLCDRARAVLLGAGEAAVVCDVASVGEPDAATVEALAGLQLTAQRLGRRMPFRHAGGRLRDLVAMMGLGDVLVLAGDLPLQAWGQAEQREQALGVEEEAEPGDPAV
jgi:hypothetical protein